MLSLKEIDIEDKASIDRYLAEEQSQSADFNFGNMFMWDERYHQKITGFAGRLIVLTRTHDKPFFVYPIGGGDLKSAVDEMRLYARENGFPFVMRGLETRHVNALEALYPGCFEFQTNRPYFDYIYSAEALSTLTGKKLHGKRNHINRFTAGYDWRFEELSEKHFDACAALLKHWEDFIEDDGDFLFDEHRAITRAFRYYGSLSLLGGALFADGRLVAFTMGEMTRHDTFDVHFEKAYWETNGAYQMINREFVNLVLEKHPQVQYINREDDMGLDNIRTTKSSYRPEYLLEKYTAVWRGRDG